MPLPALLPHCPICRASRTEERETCRRCGTELAWPLRLARQARSQEQRALYALARDDLPQALLHARLAHALHRTPFTLALLGFLLNSGEQAGSPSSLPGMELPPTPQA